MIEVLNKDVLTHIHDWISYVSSTKTSNGFLICPYANKVLLNKKLKVYYFDINNIDKVVSDFLEDSNSLKVWIFLCNDLDIEQQCLYLNNKYNSLVWLYDKSNDTGYIDSTPTGNKKYDLILLQDKKELNYLSSILEKKGYYTNWSKHYYDQIVSSRIS
jgi:hypothetical protein